MFRPPTGAVRRVFSWTLAVALAAGAATGEEPEKPPPPAPPTGTPLPQPPEQGQLWKPPKTKLPEKWVTAAAELIGCGFADPRGCEYRKITTADVLARLGHPPDRWRKLPPTLRRGLGRAGLPGGRDRATGESEGRR